MPGIVGLISKIPRERAEQELSQMVDSVRHESFYVTGTQVDPSLGAYVAWTALKSSFSEEMPLQNESGDIVLVFSGEEYSSHKTARRRAEARAHSPGERALSYLVHAYEKDPSFPASLNGRFHGLLTDRKKQTAALFNDRYGMHRIYYHESREAFYFASEAKAILAVRPGLRRASLASLGEFVACGCVLENRTLFQDIHALPPGSYWVFRDGALKEKGSYFNPREWEEQSTLDPEVYYQNLRETFSRNLPRYFQGGEPIGMSVTGGLDTRMIMAWHKSPPGSVRCYSFGGTFRDSQDVSIGKQVTAVWGQPHEVIQIGNDFLSRFAYYAERTVYLTDGCAEVNRSPDLYANEKARDIATVRLTGNYGGEILRAIRAFKPVEPSAGLFRSEFLCHIREAQKTYHRVLLKHPVSFSAFRQAPWHHYGLLALEQSQLSLRSPFLDNELVRTVFRAPVPSLLNSDNCQRLIADGNPALRLIPTDRGLNGTSKSLLSSANRAILEFLFKAEYAYDYGMPQWVAQIDNLLSPLHLERLFLGRHKFYHFRVWYRDALSKYVKEMLLDPRTLSRPYLEKKGVEAIVRGHLKGNRNYTTEIHKVLTLELLHRLFLDAR
jgi:asparagine synthase (glutamine-hydrolysing)